MYTSFWIVEEISDDGQESLNDGIATNVNVSVGLLADELEVDKNTIRHNILTIDLTNKTKIVWVGHKYWESGNWFLLHVNAYLLTSVLLYACF